MKEMTKPKIFQRIKEQYLVCIGLSSSVFGREDAEILHFQENLLLNLSLNLSTVEEM